MKANASVATKVRPMARIPIKKTGTLRISAEATGKSAAGRQPPRRLRNQKSDGAYASEKIKAEIMSERTTAPLTSAMLSPAPSIHKKVSRMAANPSSHEPMEIAISFIKVTGLNLTKLLTPLLRRS